MEELRAAVQAYGQARMEEKDLRGTAGFNAAVIRALEWQKECRAREEVLSEHERAHQCCSFEHGVDID